MITLKSTKVNIWKWKGILKMKDEMAQKLIAAYNKGFEDGYNAWLCDYQSYEKDMEVIRNDN